MSISSLPVPDLPTVPPAIFGTGSLPVRPWADEVIDALGFDPRSAYVERFWLGILGPSTTWLMRRFAAAFDSEPDGFDLPLSDTARALGLGDKGGRHSPFVRALWRCCQFDLARVSDSGVLEVRRRVPPLNRRQVLRLSEPLRAAHEAWQAAQVGARPADQARRRARALALTLLEIDPEVAAVEHRLIACGVHAAVAREATAWAWERHTTAAAAAPDAC
jgi:hypothetical protein